MHALASRRGVVALVLVAALAISVAYLVRPGAGAVTISADFANSTGLYNGSDVRIMGVKVGNVDAIEPEGDHVRVTFHVDGLQVPADAKAAIVAPSLVSGRYVQLAPAYTGGPQMEDGALIPELRTAVPVEWDDIKDQVTRLTSALAPTDGHKDGALSDLIKAGDRALGGNGRALRRTLAAMADASQSIAGSRGNLFLTIKNLASFIGAMNASSTQIKTFATELSSLSKVLGANQHQLVSLLSTTRGVVTDVDRFVRKNRGALTTTVRGVTSAASQLAAHETDLANILHLAPTTVANFYNIYDPTTGAFTGRPVIAETHGFANTVCQAMLSTGQTLQQCQAALSPLLDPLNGIQLPSIDPLNQGGTPNQATPGGSPSAQRSGSGDRPGGGHQAAGLSGLLGLLLGGAR